MRAGPRSGRLMVPAIVQGVRDDDAVFLQSDCDEQLLITINFRQVVKLHSIRIKSLNADAAPDTVKIFANPINLGFDAAESDPATQTLELSPEVVAEGQVIPLRFVKFQRVNSVSLFFPSNHGGEDQTVIHKIQLYGAGGNSTNMGDWEKVAKKG